MQLPDNTRNAAVDAVVDLLDLGTTNPVPQMLIKSATSTVLATIDLQTPAFGDSGVVNPGEASAIGAPFEDASADASGDAASYEVYDRDGVLRWSGSAGDVGTEDLVLVTKTLVAGQPVRITSFKISIPAS